MASKQLCSWWRGFKLFKEIVTQVWWKLNSKHINSFSTLRFPYATQKKMSNLMSIIATAVKWAFLHLFIVSVLLSCLLSELRQQDFFFKQWNTQWLEIKDSYRKLLVGDQWLNFCSISYFDECISISMCTHVWVHVWIIVQVYRYYSELPLGGIWTPVLSAQRGFKA